MKDSPTSLTDSDVYREDDMDDDEYDSVDLRLEKCSDGSGSAFNARGICSLRSRKIWFYERLTFSGI